MISYKHTKDGVMLRSRTRGKLALDSIESKADPSGPRTFDYKVAKPYRSHVFQDLASVQRVLRNTEGEEILINFPPLRTIMETLKDGDLERALRPFTQTAILEASQSASLNSRQYGDVLATVSALEAKETYSMVRNVFVTGYNLIFSFYKNAKRGNISGAADDLSDAWLQYRYGWRPFIGEIQALHELLTRDRSVRIHSSYGGKRFNIPDTINIGYIDVKDGSNTLTLSIDIHSADTVVKVGYNYLNTENSRNDSLLSQLGLDSEQILSTVWELIPFSFVVDFVFNIGDMLSESQHRDEIKAFNHYVSTILQHRLKVTCVALKRGMVVKDVKADMPLYLQRKFKATEPQSKPEFWDDLVRNLTDKILTVASKITMGPDRWILEDSRKSGTNWMYCIGSSDLDTWLRQTFKCTPWQKKYPGKFSWDLRAGRNTGSLDLSTLASNLRKTNVCQSMVYCDPESGYRFLTSIYKVVPRSLVVEQFEARNAFFLENAEPSKNPDPYSPRWVIKKGSQYSSLGALNAVVKERFWVSRWGDGPYDLSNNIRDFNWVTFGQIILPGQSESLDSNDLPFVDIPMSSFTRQIENPGNYTGLTIDTDLSIGQFTDLAALAKKVILSKFK